MFFLIGILPHPNKEGSKYKRLFTAPGPLERRTPHPWTGDRALDFMHKARSPIGDMEGARKRGMEVDALDELDPVVRRRRVGPSPTEAAGLACAASALTGELALLLETPQLVMVRARVGLIDGEMLASHTRASPLSLLAV